MKIPTILMLTLLAVPAIAAPDGASLFKSKCAMCHGPDGSGKTAIGKSMNVKNLSLPDVQKQTDAQLSAVVVNGKNKMPGYKGKLSADEIREIVRHVRTFRK